MAQLSIEELEELILTRDSYLHEAQASGRALAELTTQNNWRRGEIDSLREQLAAKDAEIAWLTAQLNGKSYIDGSPVTPAKTEAGQAAQRIAAYERYMEGGQPQ